MNIFDKHPLPWQAVELPEGRSVVQDVMYEFIAEFDEMAVAEWAIHAWMLAQGTDRVTVEEKSDGSNTEV